MNQDWLNFINEYYRWAITFGVIFLFPRLRKIPATAFLRTKESFNPHRKQRARILLNTLTTIVIIASLLVMWGIKLKGLLVIGSSMFALLGVALFAVWSLLSNLTSFLILFGQNDCRVGRWVRVIDGANYVEGEIIEMGFMSVQLRDHDGSSVLYPNNLFLTRPVVVYKDKPIREISEEKSDVSATNESPVTHQTSI